MATSENRWHQCIRAVGGAFSWLTVVPISVPGDRIDRRFGGAVIAAVPILGALLGVGAAGMAWALSYTNLPDTQSGVLLVGMLLVGALGVVSRGMHLDGLADTADGLGCYGPPERVAEVMRSGAAGPFGVASIVGVMLVQALGFAALAGDHRWLEIATSVLLGRVTAVIACRQRLRPAHPDGFGALVAGTQRHSVWIWTALGVATAVGAGWLGAPTDGGFGPAVRAGITAVAVIGITWVFTAHCARRLGGITGDVLGAVIELGTAIAVVGLLI
ncbi:MAG: adenosylcobinamide-GDP ribazoletransferase [Gordonia sp. (in: high G+C Gram-positive bacteria)]